MLMPCGRAVGRSFLLLYSASFVTVQAETCPNHRNITQCCERMVQETLESCLEYAALGFEPISCRSWLAEVSEACYENCGNCTGAAARMMEICKFTLQVLGNGRLITRYCTQTVYDFQHYRCPGACYDNPDDCAADEGFVPSEYTYDPDNFRPNASTCMFQCGIYQTCHCRKWRATLNDETCMGEPVIQWPNPNRTGENYTCKHDPMECRDHRAEGICRPYRWCEPDHCIMKRVKCVSPHQCLDDGVCMPVDGTCYYSNRRDGYPCDDETYYTVQDQCINGMCTGTVDYCLKYNVTCKPLSECTTGGVCHPHSGRCTYDMLPDESLCDDHRIYTVEDRCRNGLCVGNTIDLCHEMGVICTAPNECYTAGVCDPKTGQCSTPVAISEAIPCSDGDDTTQNDTCMDGVCLGFPQVMLFKTLGDGDCADRDGLRMDSYSGDVADEKECEATCLGDAQCFGYGYAFPLCSIYGTVRTTAPRNEREWAFQRGSQPTAAVIIEQAAKPAPGSRVGVCRRRGETRDVQEGMDENKIDVKYIFNPYTLSAFFTGLLLCFFIRPIARCVRVLFCGVPKDASAVVSAAPPRLGTLGTLGTLGDYPNPALEDDMDQQLRFTAADDTPDPPYPLEPAPPADPAPEVSVEQKALRHSEEDADFEGEAPMPGALPEGPAT